MSWLCFAFHQITLSQVQKYITVKHKTCHLRLRLPNFSLTFTLPTTWQRLGYGLKHPRCNSRQVQKIFPFSKIHNSSLGPTQSPAQWGGGGHFLGVKWPERKAHHPPPPDAIVKNVHSYMPLLPLCVFMVWRRQPLALPHDSVPSVVSFKVASCKRLEGDRMVCFPSSQTPFLSSFALLARPLVPDLPGSRRMSMSVSVWTICQQYVASRYVHKHR